MNERPDVAGIPVLVSQSPQEEERVRRRALEALQDRAFDLAATTVAGGDSGLAELVENLRIYQAELILQNEELQRNQQRAETAGLKFQSLFERVPVAVFVVGPRGLLNDTNTAAQSLLGLTSRRLTNTFFLRLFSRASQGAVLNGMSRSLSEGSAIAANVAFAAADGDERVGHLHITAMPSEADEPQDTVCVLLDTTDSVRQQRLVTETNQRLAASESRFRALVEQGSDIVATLSAEGYFLYVSPSWTRMLGQETAAIEGRHFSEILAVEDQQRFGGYLKRLFDGAQDPAIEFRVTRADGGSCWVSGLSRLAESAEGEHVAIVTWRDVTERREAEERIRRSEHKLASILRLAADGFWIVDREGRFVDVNEAYCGISGYSRRELLRRSVTDMEANPERGGPRECRFLRVFEVESDHFECRHRSKSGRLVDVEITGRYLPEFDHAFCFVRDVTERKRAEEALREREKLFRTLSDFAPIGIFRTDDQGAFRYSNPTWEKISGRSSESSLGFGWLQALHPDDRTQLETQWKAAVIGARSISLECRITDPSGRESWITMVACPLWLSQGNFSGMIGTVEDITERKQADQESRLNLQRLQGLLDLAQRAPEITEAEVLQEGLAAAVRLTQSASGYLRFRPAGDERSELCISLPSELAATVEASAAVERRLSVPLLAGERLEMEIAVFHKAIPYDGADVRLVTVLAGDVLRIVERSRAQQKLRLLAKVYESSAEGVVIVEAGSKIVAVNRAFTEITGYREDEMLGLPPAVLKSDCHEDKFYSVIQDALERHGSWRGELVNRRKNGEVYHAWLTISSVQDEHGRLTHYVGVFSDITAIKQSEEKLDFLAHHDPLTSLPNRLLFNARLEAAIGRASRNGRKLAVLFLDLDRFKGVNDSLGHHVGDALLQSVARETGAVLRGEDLLARIGGDEFIVLLHDVLGVGDVINVVKRLMRVFASPIHAASHELYLTVSIGISLFPDDGQVAADLIRNADAAMYLAKTEGRNTYRFYNPRITAQALQRLRLETELRKALQSGGLSLHFQPQLELASGRLLGAEVLVRWHHDELGTISPYLFIPVAEETGLIAAVGDFVLHNACRQLRSWRDAGFVLPSLSVNLSVAQMERQDVATMVKDALTTHCLKGSELELEITESVIMRHTDRAIETLNCLRGLGVRLAIDDFGSGFSSLTYLKRLPIQKLKIDQSFVSNIGVDANDEAIVRAIVALSASLGLEVIAEGVETELQARFLREAGCGEGQGYLFSKALPADAFVDRYQSWEMGPVVPVKRC